MLHIQNLSLSIGHKHILEGVTFSLDSNAKKKIALIGANGAGKSTLLRTLSGELAHDSGTISRNQEIVVYLKQDPEFPKDTLAGEYLEKALEEYWMLYKVDLAIAEVGLSPEKLIQDCNSLSGGEKIRLSIAHALLSEPTILLLDEPTNHLDLEGLLWLGKFFQEFTGSIVLISHDRVFLNEYVNEVWEIDTANHDLRRYSGNYDDYLAEKTRLFDREMGSYEKHMKEIEEVRLWLKENEFHPKFRFSDRVMSKKKVLAELEATLPVKPQEVEEMRIKTVDAAHRGTLIKAVIRKKAFGDNVIFENKEITVKAGERIAIIGPNGAGKSTLLNILGKVDRDFEGEVEYKDGAKIAYLKQTSLEDSNDRVLDYFYRLKMTDEGTARKNLASCLFRGDQVMARVKDLSFGERKRLELCLLLFEKPTVLLMDEPTNHLDLFAREDLEACLLASDLPMVIISHDRYFLNKIGITREVKVGG